MSLPIRPGRAIARLVDRLTLPVVFGRTKQPLRSGTSSSGSPDTLRTSAEQSGGLDISSQDIAPKESGSSCTQTMQRPSSEGCRLLRERYGIANPFQQEIE